MYRLTNAIRSAVFSHANGMVDIAGKPTTERIASASCSVLAPQRIVDAIFSDTLKVNSKGDILSTARIAGTLAAKRTSELIPFCHQIPLSQVSIEITRDGPGNIKVRAQAKTIHQTGVEMEALTAVSLSALTIYDMTKSALKCTTDSIVITEIQLDYKTGGSSKNIPS